MRYAYLLILFVGLYVLGRVLSPYVTDALIDDGSKRLAKLTREVKLAKEGLKFKINLADYNERDLPERVKVVKEVTLPLVDVEGEKVIPRDSEVLLKSRNGDRFFVETEDGLAKGEIGVDLTDIFQILALRRHEEMLEKQGSGPARSENSEEASQATQESEKEEGGQIDEEESMEKEPEVDEEEAVEEGPVGDLDAEGIVAAMKKSVEARIVKEFKVEDVQEWLALPEKETIDNVEYQVGTAKYKTETIFGLKDVLAKGLIRNGRVEKWIYANTGMQIP